MPARQLQSAPVSEHTGGAFAALFLICCWYEHLEGCMYLRDKWECIFPFSVLPDGPPLMSMSTDEMFWLNSLWPEMLAWLLQKLFEQTWIFMPETQSFAIKKKQL